MSMPSRRVPLSSNPNVANSPLRGASTLASYAKQKRSHATAQREEPYGQQPPVKKQALENASRRPRSPSKIARPQSQLISQRGTTRPATKDRSARAVVARPDHDAESDKEVWKKHHRAKFPKMVFYFESIPDEVRTKLTKRVLFLGARQESFFSIDVTHIISGRPIPTERHEAEEADADKEHGEQEPQEQPQTINPSLLDIDRRVPARRRLFEFGGAPMRSHQLDDPTKRAKNNPNTDVLCKARDMGIKIWSLDKFQNMLSVLLETDTPQNSTVSRTYKTSKSSHEPNLLQLLRNERINGPSDRDPTAVNRELNYFKGPYIYIWDMDEKLKPTMVREYAKVVNKSDGDWPQFRSVGNGRCPFVEEVDVPEKESRRSREQEKARETARAARQESVPVLRPPEIPKPKAVTGKRSLTEMEDGHNRARGVAQESIFNPPKPAAVKQAATRPENAFISRAPGGRLFAGEPVASGLQASNVTSAIRSQMISSTSGIHGAKAGTSKEIHGLQRKVLQKAVPTGSTQGASSRPTAEASMDAASSRSASLSRQTSKTTRADEDSQKLAERKETKSQAPPLKSKKDLKPGYCENCQDKFRDFDEHILSRKHRRFAENDDNWGDLDDLLRQLSRNPRFASHDSDEEF